MAETARKIGLPLSEAARERLAENARLMGWSRSQTLEVAVRALTPALARKTWARMVNEVPADA